MTTDALTSPAGQAAAPPAIEAKWSFAKRIGFRFAFCYWLLYCLPQPFVQLLPGGRYLGMPFGWFWGKLTPWVGQHVFHLSGHRITYFPTGSGDTTLEYIQNLLVLVLAVLATLAWSVVDRKRQEYGTAHGWLRIFVRFVLAVTLFSYGFSKIVPLQFRPPSLARLTETYGESSPMGLLWTFMGTSMAYTIFSGVAEAFAATLLVFRRTALLGALVSAAVLLNIVMLNFCYDVPVKLYSSNLLLMALFLLLPDLSRLANVFLLDRAAPPANLTVPCLPKRWMRIIVNVALPLLVVIFVAMGVRGHLLMLRSMNAGDIPQVKGGFDVEAIQINGRPAAAVDPSNADWKQIVAAKNYWLLRRTDGTSSYFSPTYRPKTNSVELASEKTGSRFQFDYSWQDAGHLVLTGKMGNETLVARLKKIDEKKFLLTNRGFHWISEYPFNR